MLYALGTDVFIAGYTVMDSLGARLAESARSYTFWVHLLYGIPITLLALYSDAAGFWCRCGPAGRSAFSAAWSRS